MTTVLLCFHPSNRRTAKPLGNDCNNDQDEMTAGEGTNGEGSEENRLQGMPTLSLTTSPSFILSASYQPQLTLSLEYPATDDIRLALAPTATTLAIL
jgi:hypothetical protein